MSARDLRSTTTWWCSFYLLMTTVQFNRAQSPFSSGSFLGDPFLDVTNGLSSTPSITKVNKVEPLCISQGALAGAIIGTMLLSVFIGFLTWLVYLRPKFQGWSCLLVLFTLWLLLLHQNFMPWPNKLNSLFLPCHPPPYRTTSISIDAAKMVRLARRRASQ